MRPWTLRCSIAVATVLACSSVVHPGCSGGEIEGCPVGSACDDQDPCTTNDTCREGGACAGEPLRCEDTPPSTCKDEETLLVFTSPGVCENGQCRYPQVEVVCPQGCAGDDCAGDPCAGVECDDPPPSECSSAMMLRTFAAPGTCTQGVCTYPFDDSYCPYGCENGSCREDPGTDAGTDAGADMTGDEGADGSDGGTDAGGDPCQGDSCSDDQWVQESARSLPRAYDVDVVVVGGSSSAVAAAVEASNQGALVFLAAPRPYLGEDICATMRLWLEPGETASVPLAQQLFPNSGPIRPLHIKRSLDAALENAGVEFLYGCYPTELLRDANGEIAGLVMANRSGRQAVRAKVIVDATDRAWVARMAGASFDPYPPGPKTFTRVVVGGQAQSGTGMTVRTLPFQIGSVFGQKNVYEYTLTLSMTDGSFRSLAEAEQVARDRTFHPGQVDESEVLFGMPPDPMEARASLTGPWPGAGQVDLDAFRPDDVDRLYILGGCADISRDAAAEMLRPIESMHLGTRVGEAAAAEALALPALQGVHLPAQTVTSVTSGDVGEFLQGVRPGSSGATTVPASARGLPVLGEYDVVVVGGGTGGAPAGIGAGRQGVSTLLIEYLHGLGGVGTHGLIGRYHHGYRHGFTAEAEDGIEDLGASSYVVGKKEWWRRENRSAGVEIWFGTMGVGAFTDGDRVKGVVVATPEGRGVVLADVVIDSTGNSDIAATAGAACMFMGPENVAVQGTGLPPRDLGEHYTNTDYTFSDDSDPVDRWHLFVWAREKFPNAYDLGQLIDTRERRRIVGDYMVSLIDIVVGRTYSDSVVFSQSNFDSHGFTIHPYLYMVELGRLLEIYAYTPYRSLLPADLDGILVTGLGISAHRDAIPILRMQADVQNQGYAAGRAAAMAVSANQDPRDININTLQQHLVNIGNLPTEALSHTNVNPITEAQVGYAVDVLADRPPGPAADDADAAPAFDTTGYWRQSQAVSGYYGSGYLATDEKGPTATWTRSIAQPGPYGVYMRWTELSNRVPSAPVDIVHAGGSTRVQINQQAQGSRWNLLGMFDFDASSTVILRTQGTQAGKFAIADAVSFIQSDVADDADAAPAFSTTGNWRESQAIGGHYGPGYRTTDEKGPTATWTQNLPQAGEYAVYMRWTQLSNRVNNAPVDVVHAGGTTRVYVNQRNNGSRWNRLGRFDFDSSGTVILRTQGTAAGQFVVADAVVFARTDQGGVGNQDLIWLVGATMARPNVAVPLLYSAHNDPTTAQQGKLRCAQLLGLLGDDTGADSLIAAVESYAQFDEGWNFKGGGQFGTTLSLLDSYILALGGTRDGGALGPLLSKLALLDASKELSHHRSVAVALETLADPAAAQPLAQLLQKPGMTGYSVLTLDDARIQYGPDHSETVPRNNSLRELILARALYRCGDHQELGRAILELYANDLRGPYARHARAVLENP